MIIHRNNIYILFVHHLQIANTPCLSWYNWSRIAGTTQLQYRVTGSQQKAGCVGSDTTGKEQHIKKSLCLEALGRSYHVERRIDVAPIVMVLKEGGEYK